MSRLTYSDWCSLVEQDAGVRCPRCRGYRSSISPRSRVSPRGPLRNACSCVARPSFCRLSWVEKRVPPSLSRVRCPESRSLTELVASASVQIHPKGTSISRRLVQCHSDELFPACVLLAKDPRLDLGCGS